MINLAYRIAALVAFAAATPAFAGSFEDCVRQGMVGRNEGHLFEVRDQCRTPVQATPASKSNEANEKASPPQETAPSVVQAAASAAGSPVEHIGSSFVMR